MRNATKLLPLALLMLAAFPAAAQENPRVLFCMGQCFGVDEKGVRVPVAKGTDLAPGQRIETGPNSYAQVKLGRDTAFGIGERARVRFDRRDAARDVVILDEGRIRLVGGEAIGRPATRPVELQTTEGNFVLRSADIEVKMLPKTGDAAPTTTLVKLNLGDARLGELPITRESVQGIVGGKVLDRAIPIGDIAMAPRKDIAPVAPTTTRSPVGAMPVLGVQPTEVKSSPILTLAPVQMPEVFSPKTYTPIVPPVSKTDLMLAAPLTSASDAKSLNDVSKIIQQEQKVAVLAPPTSTPPPPSVTQQLLTKQVVAPITTKQTFTVRR